MLRSRLYLLGAAALWSTAGAAMKLCHLSGWQIAGGRSLIAGAFLWLVLPEARRRPSRRMALAVAGYAGTVILFSVANKLTTSANAIFIQDSAPLWVLLLSPFLLGERAARSELFAIPIYGAGLSLFFLDRLSPGQLAGNLVALGSGLTFALCIAGLRAARGDAPAALVFGNLLAAALALPLWSRGPSPDGLDLAWVAYLGAFQLGLAYLLFARGIAHTPALEASLLVLLEPVLNPVWTFFLAGERPGPWALLGGAVVLGATVWRTAAPAAHGGRRVDRPAPGEDLVPGDSSSFRDGHRQGMPIDVGMPVEAGVPPVVGVGARRGRGRGQRRRRGRGRREDPRSNFGWLVLAVRARSPYRGSSRTLVSSPELEREVR
jgi:DME family drug/metabolite transporter